MDKNAKIYVAGHRGLVGSALMRQLQTKGYANIVTRTHAELDLTNQETVKQFFEAEKPEYVILAAAKVGGVVANYIYTAGAPRYFSKPNGLHWIELFGLNK